MNWYQRDVEKIFHELSASEEGLTEKEAKERLAQYGRNKLAEEEKVSRLRIIVGQFANPLIYILLIAAIITAFFREYVDTGVIVSVILLNAFIGYLQEYKAEQSVKALKKMLVPKARVVRDGTEKEIGSEELVPGDIVVFTSGVKVPADVRLFSSKDLRVDEAMLTGESIPAEKGVDAIDEKNLPPGDQKNMAFMGTVVVSGRAKGIVVDTGQRTVLGQIAREVKELSVTRTPIQEKIGRFAKFIGLIVSGSVAAIFILGLTIGQTASEMFMTAVSASVAAIPEGLPIVVTITMAVGINRMARKNAIIRKLPAVETLGSTTVICSDKTGTLTKNEMTVTLISDGDLVYELTGNGYEPKGEFLHEGHVVDPMTLSNLRMLLRIGMLCNESRIYEEEGQHKVDGDPTEGAVIVSAIKGGLRLEEEQQRYPRLAMIPFESERGYMATLHQDSHRKLIFVKGAPEQVIGLCTRCSVGPGSISQRILDRTRHFGIEGTRVLAMAYKEAPDDLVDLTHDGVEGHLTFAGVQGMIDPPRAEAIDAVRGCKDAGIRVVMITGDHADTASAISKGLGLTDEEPRVITGRQLGAMSDEELFESVQDVPVFARVSPQHKLRVVHQLMRRCEVVAATGDGVNDAPALKAAHIGVAMGRSGTDVAKEASDMLIMDDNFASIFSAVEEGRVVFENIRKVILFLIPTGFAAILSILAAMFLGIPIPYVPAQLLWINLVTNGLQDMALAFEPGEKDIIKRPPRHPREGIMSRAMIERSIIVALVISAGVVFNYVTTLNGGASLEEARTVAVTTMVFFQFFQAWNSRSGLQSVFRMRILSNPFLFYSVVGAFFAQMAVVYVPALQWIFRTVPLTGVEWLQAGVIAVSVVIAVEADKAIRRSKRGVETLDRTGFGVCDLPG